jgi:hypothetical protein
MATFTTVKVTAETRDRLKHRADEGKYSSIDVLLNELLDERERAEQIAEFRAVMARVTPEEWADYMVEVSTMDASLSDGLDPNENWEDEWQEE